MKSKLRKEFEEYKRGTDERFYELFNPPKFKFNDEILVSYDYGKKTYNGICKGHMGLERREYGRIVRMYNIESGDCICQIEEEYLFNKDAFANKPR